MTARKTGLSGPAERRALTFFNGAAWTSALAITLAVSPGWAAQAKDPQQQILDRLNKLDQRVGTLENEVKDRDSKIQNLENTVHERDATIQQLKQSGGQASQQGAANQFPAPAAGAVPAAEQTQRLDNLERTVRQLNEITNAQQDQIKTSSDVKVTTKGGLKVETSDGQFSFQPFGRMHYDAAWYDQDKSHLGDGSQLRRARLGMTGKMFGDWQYKVEADFGRDTGAGTVGMKEAWIKWTGIPDAEFLVGNVPVPFGLEQYTSDNFITFVERALPSPVFAPERLLGGVAGYYQPDWSIAGGVYGRSVDDPTNIATPTSTAEGDQQTVFTARGTFDPISEKDKLVHLGVGFLYKNPNNQQVALSSKPESNITAAKFVNTSNIFGTTAGISGAIPNVDHLYEVNPEMALIYGPASLQGEYFWTSIARTQPNGTTTSPSVDVSGWYAQASYFLTGESRNYNPKIAKFDRITPMHNLGKDGYGALELAARVSNLNLDDGQFFQAGDETDYALGLNWYVNPYIRFMFNYIFVQNNASAVGNKGNLLPGVANDSYDDPRIAEFRAQVDF